MGKKKVEVKVSVDGKEITAMMTPQELRAYLARHPSPVELDVGGQIAVPFDLGRLGFMAL